MVIVNKKGQIAEGVLILAVIFVMAQALYVASVHQEFVAQSVGNLEEVQNFYANLDRADFLNKESARLAIQQAYFDMTDRPSMKGECTSFTIGGKQVPLLNGSCMPDNERTRAEFIRSVSENFARISGNQKFEIRFEGEEILFNPSDTKSTVHVVGDIMTYNLSHQFDSSFMESYPDLDLEGVSSRLIAQRNGCRNSPMELEQCIESANMPSWIVHAQENGHLIVTLLSNKSYFYNGGFKPVELKFAMPKLS